MDSFIVMSTDHVQKVHLCVGDKTSCYKGIPPRDKPIRGKELN